MSKRVVTSELAEPAPADIRKWDGEFQADMKDKRYAGKPERFVVADETGVVVEPPKTQWVPKDASRAAAPKKSKKRITAMITLAATGVLLPLFLIVGCTATGFDLSSSTILPKILEERPFRLHGSPSEWALLEWSANLPLKLKGAKVHTFHEVTRPYLQHVPSGSIVTIQPRAWMDTIALCMYTQLILVPYMSTFGGLYMVWDNCGPHLARAVREMMPRLACRSEGWCPTRPLLCRYWTLASTRGSSL